MIPPPAFPGDAPDPSITTTPDGYVAYSTEVVTAQVPARWSPDLVRWSAPVETLPRLPRWAARGRTWSPVVAAVGGRWVLWAAVRSRNGHQQCLLAASASSPLGPFVGERRPLEQSPGGTWALDPSVHRDAAGDLWLLWKTDLDRGAVCLLMARRLAESGLSFARGSAPVELLRSGAAWEGGIIEAPCLLVLGGTTWLFYSGNRWQSDRYAIGLAACPSGPAGPAVKLTTGMPWLASDPGGAGPGGQEPFTDHAGRQGLVFHAWEPGRVGYHRRGARTTRLLALGLGPDGIPRPVPPTPSGVSGRRPARPSGSPSTTRSRTGPWPPAGRR